VPLTVAVEVPPRDREQLVSWVRSPSMRAGWTVRGFGQGVKPRESGVVPAPRKSAAWAGDPA